LFCVAVLFFCVFHDISFFGVGSLVLLWLPGKRVMGFAVFCCGLGVGLFLGWVQQMRGAHFLTHTLWSAWIASALILLLIGLFTVRR
jgi:membrane-associated PAP2 superfamily phosphatase